MKILFDANLSYRIANGLNILEQGNDKKKEIIANIFHADQIESLGQGATDEQIIYYANKTGAIIISQDDDFKRIKSNLNLLKQLNVGYVLYRPPKHGSRYWEIVVSFVNAWKDLKEKLHNEKPPFIYQIDKFGRIEKKII